MPYWTRKLWKVYERLTSPKNTLSVPVCSKFAISKVKYLLQGPSWQTRLSRVLLTARELTTPELRLQKERASWRRSIRATARDSLKPSIEICSLLRSCSGRSHACWLVACVPPTRAAVKLTKRFETCTRNYKKIRNELCYKKKLLGVRKAK